MKIIIKYKFNADAGEIIINTNRSDVLERIKKYDLFWTIRNCLFGNEQAIPKSFFGGWASLVVIE